MSGNSATLRCSSNITSSSIAWQYPPGTLVVRNCVVEPGYASQYSVDKSATGQCDLLVLSATASLAGAYQCVDTGFSNSNAYLVVLGEFGI